MKSLKYFGQLDLPLMVVTDYGFTHKHVQRYITLQSVIQTYSKICHTYPPIIHFNLAVIFLKTQSF